MKLTHCPSTVQRSSERKQEARESFWRELFDAAPCHVFFFFFSFPVLSAIIHHNLCPRWLNNFHRGVCAHVCRSSAECMHDVRERRVFGARSGRTLPPAPQRQKLACSSSRMRACSYVWKGKGAGKPTESCFCMHACTHCWIARVVWRRSRKMRPKRRDIIKRCLKRNSFLRRRGGGDCGWMENRSDKVELVQYSR